MGMDTTDNHKGTNTMNSIDTIKYRTSSWTWRDYVNHSRFCMTTDFLGFVGPCATINRSFHGAGDWRWSVRIADRDGDVIVEHVVAVESEELAKKRAFSLLLQHVG